MRPFHVHLYGPKRGPLESSFAAARGRLERLPRVCFEPDGSFVWTSPAGGQQVFGMLYDAAERIQYCELRGQCDRQHWQQIVQAISGSAGHGLEILQLPDARLQNLQSFVDSHWPSASSGQ